MKKPSKTPFSYVKTPQKHHFPIKKPFSYEKTPFSYVKTP
jgi:hypothetical protein